MLPDCLFTVFILLSRDLELLYLYRMTKVTNLTGIYISRVLASCHKFFTKYNVIFNYNVLNIFNDFKYLFIKEE